jgi:hypothetical protein
VLVGHITTSSAFIQQGNAVMDQLPERTSSGQQDGTTPQPASRQLPSGKNSVQRITDQSKGLVDDLKSWVDLRIKLAQVEVEQRVQAKVNELALRIAPIIVGALGGLFLLVTLALGLGWWLGQNFWGFLIVTLLLLLVAAVLRAVGQRQRRQNKNASAAADASGTSS